MRFMIAQAFAQRVCKTLRDHYDRYSGCAYLA
jgi:hypothetical protein